MKHSFYYSPISSYSSKYSTLDDIFFSVFTMIQALDISRLCLFISSECGSQCVYIERVQPYRLNVNPFFKLSRQPSSCADVILFL